MDSLVNNHFDAILFQTDCKRGFLSYEMHNLVFNSHRLVILRKHFQIRPLQVGNRGANKISARLPARHEVVWRLHSQFEPFTPVEKMTIEM